MRKATANFEQNSILLLIFTLTSSFCNYLFQVLTGNLLSAADYGTVNALLSLSIIISVPTTIFTVISSKYTTAYLTLNQPERAAKWLIHLEKAALVFAIATLLAGILLSNRIAKIFQIEYRWYVFAAFGLAAVSYFFCPLSGALQGAKKFTQYGVATLILSGAKLLISVVLILIGVRILGAVFAISIGTILATVFAAISLSSILRMNRKSDSFILDKGIKRYITGALFVQICNAILANGDMLLVKAYATLPAEVGVYSSAIVIGKIPLYVAGALIAVLFPMVSEAATKNEVPKALFLKSILYGGGIAIAFALFLQLFGIAALKIMFGERYLSAFPLFLPVSIFITFVTLITIEINYLLALGRNRFLVISLLLGFIAIYALIWIFHQSISQMLYIISGVLAIVFLANGLYVLFLKPSSSPMKA